jgi:hypothetical protein
MTFSSRRQERSVSLVNTESQSSHADDEDKEELEYLENPFEGQ